MAVKSIFAAVEAQDVEELEEDCVGYKNKTIKTIIKQLQMWYVITTKENIAIKSQFLVPWRNSPNTHVTTFTHQLDMRQV